MIEEITSPPFLDDTAQEMVTKLQAIANNINNNAGQVSYSNTTSQLQAGTVQTAIDEVKGITDTISSSLTQLPPNISFGSPEVITWTNDKFTCPNSGVITGYLRKSANSTAGLFGLLSNKVPNGDYRAIKNFYTTSEYQDLNLLVVKGEELTIGNKTEIGTIHLIYIPFAQNS